jgi:site-specific DNA-methyltransferase (adenine-specific)
LTLKINNVYNIDCFEGLTQIKPESVDFLLTDPPFGINFHKMGTQYNRSQKELGKMYTEVSEVEYYDFTLNWLKIAWKTLKPTASGLIFSGWSNLGDILNALAEVGGRLVNHIIWKYQFGVFTKKKFVSSHYHILYFTKLKEKDDYLRTFNRISEYTNSKNPKKLYFEDVWIIKRDYQKGGEKTPTRLPLAVTDKCVRMCSNEGDIILEPFMGSGSVVLSCLKYNRKFIGFEISQSIFNVALNRIEKMKEELTKSDGLDNWFKKK